MHLVTRTLKLKVRPESDRWLNAAAVEVNQVFSDCNETSYLAATRMNRKRRWLSGIVRRGERHHRDVNAARNILRLGSRCWTGVDGNESLTYALPPSHLYQVREVGYEAQKRAASAPDRE